MRKAVGPPIYDSSAIPSLYSLPSLRAPTVMPDAMLHPLRGLRGMKVRRCHPLARRSAWPAHRALLETCALHRASLHCAA